MFSSALEQSEQLFAAAAAVGVATSPILIFYGLSQAGRAIAAAHAQGSWRLTKHGIGIGSTPTTGSTLAALTVVPHDGGSFGRVREVLASSRLPDETTLGELWPLLSKTVDRPLLDATDDRSLVISPETSMWTGGIPAMHVSNLPGRLADGVEMVPPYVASLGANYLLQSDAVHAYLSRYPTLSRRSPFTASGDPIGMHLHDDGTCSVLIRWDVEGATDNDFADTAASIGVREHDGWHVYPSLDGEEQPVHPLIVWWAVLFRLSMLARYEPEQWEHLTNVNASADAVPIEHLLKVALTSVPELLYQVMTVVDPPCQQA